MRFFITVILFLCLCCQCFVQLGLIGWYELNKKYIAQNLCENRDKPAMHCNGKCCLKRQLKKLDEEKGQQNNGSSSKQVQPDAVVFIVPPAISWQFNSIAPARTFTTVYKDDYHFEPFGCIFRPPCYNAVLS